VRILADENIPYAREAFSTLGEVRISAGRAITRSNLADIDLLIIRSQTSVTAELVEGTPVRFVTTATSGSDHVCEEDLQRLGIPFYAALGCNANSVAEFMVAAWLTLAQKTSVTLRGRRVGVVGVGHVGELVAEKARALGMMPVLNDPPRARETGRADFRPLEELVDCDIITCHTPLTRAGADPTSGLIGEPFLSRLKAGAWLCNSGRGGVIDEAALRASLATGRIGGLILDVWDHEPQIDPWLLDAADIATPHIAGHSLEGKAYGTQMVYEAACRFLRREPAWDVARALPPPEVPEIRIDARERDDEAVLADVVSRIYPILRDDAALRRTMGWVPVDRGREFDRLRRTYPVRREFRHTRVSILNGSDSLNRALRGLKFVTDARG
jgi:erythronate-4-phosphate dehydrogenase